MTIREYTCVLAGGERFAFTSLCDAIQAVRRFWPAAYFQGDGRRVLAWTDEAASQDDDGARAVATIQGALS
jgi:hypothetical protein